MMEEELFKELIVNKSLYIGNEQHPLYKIFNAKINQMFRAGTKTKSQRTYSKDNGRTR